MPSSQLPIKLDLFLTILSKYGIISISISELNFKLER